MLKKLLLVGLTVLVPAFSSAQAGSKDFGDTRMTKDGSKDFGEMRAPVSPNGSKDFGDS